MTEPRRSTVYDYSDLRLHPDGTRVLQQSSNRRKQLAKVTVQTVQNQWIATDAGGSGKVPQFKRKRRDASAEQEDFEDRLHSSDEPTPGSATNGTSTTAKRKSKGIDRRKAKRNKFRADDEYLAHEEGPSFVQPSSVSSKTLFLPEPSPVRFVVFL